MTLRTAYKERTGRACDNCGTGYLTCSRRIFEKNGKPCCTECTEHETHDVQPPFGMKIVPTHAAVDGEPPVSDINDRELHAIHTILNVLRPLEISARDRVWDYIRNRVDDEGIQ